LNYKLLFKNNVKTVFIPFPYFANSLSIILIIVWACLIIFSSYNLAQASPINTKNFTLDLNFGSRKNVLLVLVPLISFFLMI